MSNALTEILKSNLQSTPLSASTLVAVMVFWLLRQGMTAAARPGASKAHVLRMLLVTLVSVGCLLLAVVVAQSLAVPAER